MASAILRRLANSRPSSFMAARSSFLSPSRNETLLLSSAAATVSFSTLFLSGVGHMPLFSSLTAPLVSSVSPSTLHFNRIRNFSTDSSGGSNLISIETEEQFRDSLRKAQDEALPAMFYFTAAWCGPCRLLAPIISQLSAKYPHVTTYKIDIDKEALGTALSESNVEAVPTIHFFQNGKKASTVVGADVEKLRSTMENLYK
ncbi:OLC1v1025463C1 [Oldenlandia corymbosa var. corymbosa]|uniref:OLC1v1025463C1 n=1 Tax=Oldenlandia corymbosa var. corymbosa TaxID=529605 RepID=A0AAV1C561_OLDCO|nr:OLC1v1025463C1 [Oldenlandia corymbosa var. corymbosa]